MKIILILRSRLKGGRSIEGIFESLQNYLSRQIDIASWEYDSGKSLMANLQNIKLQNATIIHITSDLYYLLLFLRKKNAIITIHDIGRYKELTGWKKIVLGNVWIKWPATLAKKITTVSHYTEQDLRKHFPTIPADKLIVIYNAIHPEFKPVTKEFNTRKPVLLQVGTAKHKNLATLISAAKQFQCTLSIVGKITSEEELLLKENKIDFQNYLDLTLKELKDRYSQCDIVVFCSLHEGFGLPVIEAQAIGRPVITTRLASLPEIAGKGAHYVKDPLDAQELKESIEKISRDSAYRQELIEAGFRNVDRFQQEKIYPQYLELYRQIERE